MIITNLNKFYKNNHVLKNVNMIASENGIYYIHAPNGSGKSTLFKCILSLEKYEGTINIEKDIFTIFDDNPLFLNLTAYENAYIILNNKITKKEINEIGYVLFDDILILNKKVKHLSLGQKKMISFVIMLLSKRKYFIIDELTNGVDLANKKRIYKVLKHISKKKKIFVTGHDIDFYKNVSDFFYIIENNTLKKIDKDMIGEFYE